MPMIPARRLRSAALIAMSAVILSGCAAGSDTRTTFKADKDTVSSMQSVLVIGVAGTRNSRAKFERALVQRLRQEGVSATAYYSVGKDAELSQEAISGAALDLGVDAVLVTRESGRDASISVRDGSSSMKGSTKDGGLLNLFRYDYEELNEPSSLKLDVDLTLTTDLYSIAGKSLVWTGESRLTDQDNIEIVIDSAARSIASKVIDSGFLAP